MNSDDFDETECLSLRGWGLKTTLHGVGPKGPTPLFSLMATSVTGILLLLLMQQ